MAVDTNVFRLGFIIWNKRQRTGIGLRAASEQCGISASTLSRLERGIGSPDTEVMRKLSEWLNISVAELLFEEGEREYDTPQALSTPDTIAMYLRADTKLSSEAAHALSELVRIAYTQLSSKD